MYKVSKISTLFKRSGFVHIEILIVILLVAVVGVVVFVVSNPISQDEMPARPEMSPTANVGGSDWRRYEGKKISFRYPSEYVYFIDENENVHFFETQADLHTCQKSGNCFTSVEFTFAGNTKIDDIPSESELVEPRRVGFEAKSEWLVESVEAVGLVYTAYSTNNNPNIKVRIEGGKKAVEDRDKYLDLYDKVLSTFEFID